MEQCSGGVMVNKVNVRSFIRSKAWYQYHLIPSLLPPPFLHDLNMIAPGVGGGVVHTDGVLGLVHEALLGASMNRLVLATTELVGDLLCGRLAVVGLGAASDLVGTAGDAFFGLLEGGLGGVGSLRMKC
jgi:hypothetical protein